MIHLSHPTGNRNVREALAALDDAGMLGRFTTTIAWRGGAWNQVLPGRLVSTLERRAYSPSILSKTLSHPTRALANLLLGDGIARRWATHETGPISTDGVFREFDRWAACHLVPSAKAVHCYEDSALETFRAAKARGSQCIYEHPVGYWRYVELTFAEESERSPEYLSILPGMNDSPAKRARKDEEIAMADLLLLSSSYSERTLALYPGKLPPTVTIPYGAPFEIASTPSPPSKKLRVAFVGGLSQLKGMSYLVEAITRVKGLVDVTIVGRRVASCTPLDRFLETVAWHESIPHAQVLQVLRECDVLLLPSLTDGFGLVVLEAMSQGLTAIVSDHAGVSDVVEHGKNGFVTPVRGVDEMVTYLESLAADPERLVAMKEAALITAAEYTWERYRRSLISAMHGLGLSS